MRRKTLTYLVASVGLLAGACAGKIAQPSLSDLAPVAAEAAPAQAVPDILPVVDGWRLAQLAGQRIVVPAQPLPDSCDIFKKKTELEAEMARMLADGQITLYVGRQDIRYTEVRAGKKKSYKDPEKKIHLGLLNEETCESRVVTITKHGADLIAPSGYSIEVVTRANGVQWNNWNTIYRVTQPEGFIVVTNLWPYVAYDSVPKKVKTRTGRISTVYQKVRRLEPLFYSPYSPDLHQADVVKNGRQHMDDLVRRAYDDLKARGVMSRAFPGVPIGDTPTSDPTLMHWLALVEQTDMTEFSLDPRWANERVYTIVGMNRDRAASYTCSSADACGLMQFTPPTYRLMREQYRAASLSADFEAGTRDALNSMKAAILLDDNIIKLLIDTLGSSIVNDRRLREYRAALYNASPKRVLPAIRQGIRHPEKDWTSYLPRRIKQETGGYIVKIRWQEQSLVALNSKTP